MTITNFWSTSKLLSGRRGHNRMVVGYITTHAISAYHHWHCNQDHDQERCTRYNITWWFVSDLWRVGGFLRVHWFPPPTVRHQITEILLKMTLNTIKFECCVQYLYALVCRSINNRIYWFNEPIYYAACNMHCPRERCQLCTKLQIKR